MKQFLYMLAFPIAALTAACASDKDEFGGGTDDAGAVRLAVVASAQVEADTRAMIELPAEAVPDPDRFALHITGVYNDDMGNPQSYDQSWETVGAFPSPKMFRGTYTASVAYGDMETEGPRAACFKGSQEFSILARKTVTATVKAALQNAAFRVSMGAWFTKYYTDVLITIRTESGHEFTFTPASQEVMFVKPGTKLFLQGTAVKSQTGTQVAFPETQIGTTAARTLHTINVDASQAGSGKLVIDLNDTFTAIPEQVIELNPEA